ncbi:uncharacterized protein LOC114219863 [Eumetopias jubatus]|uniref:uncharacterized protein LOC114219863 n=1 Tax=Eumetopias jubatus TaxID=34886 RepID=UPI0010169E9C|nr:uncharacterized protein LOC114219863 [Eumetopias jubatus]
MFALPLAGTSVERSGRCGAAGGTLGPGESAARAAVGRVGGCAAPRVSLRAGAEARGRRASRAVAVAGPTERRPQSGPGAPAGRTAATGESTRPRRFPRGRCGERRRLRAPRVGVAATDGHGGGLRVLSFRLCLIRGLKMKLLTWRAGICCGIQDELAFTALKTYVWSRSRSSVLSSPLEGTR